ncbi:MAG: hypothetical protein K0U04_04920, partial [Proteobacteria bacterium]|nr:hypothetical protein [Pseudomonadota bacterium]
LDEDDKNATENEVLVKYGKRQPIPGEKLTRAERNKQRRKRGMEVVRRGKLRKTVVAAELRKAPLYISELEEEEKNAKDRRDVHEQYVKDRLQQEPVPVLSSGKAAIHEPQVEVALPSDLTGSMRTMKPHGGIALERFRSLHTRNMIEVPDPDAFKR